jgi:hypothetical protein
MELMRFVDEHQIDFGSLPTSYGLNAAHLDGLIAIGALVDALHDADAVNPSASSAATVWSIKLTAGTVKATRFPLSSARWMMCAAVRVLPKPVGAWSIGRRWPDASEDRSDMSARS